MPFPFPIPFPVLFPSQFLFLFPIPILIPIPQDWQVHYQQDAPVAPRFDVNAPDLYIPGTAPTPNPDP